MCWQACDVISWLQYWVHLRDPEAGTTRAFPLVDPCIHGWPHLSMLGAICGSAISMDLLAQSMDPYSAQKSMDCADICGSLRVVACAVRGKYSPARQRYYDRTRVCCAISVVIFLDSLHYMFGQLFPTYQSGAKRKCVIIVILRQVPVPALSACREDVPTPTVCDFVPWIVEAHD